jgi:glycogen operon protein
VSYNERHNHANHQYNTDGHGDNRSSNYGVEGPTDDPEIRETRERQKRNMMATLLLSQGTPMILAGDEFGHSQGGNNNAYAQDNEITWLDWDGIGEEGRGLREFTRKLIAVRKAYPILHRGRFLVGEYNEELDVKDVTWLSTDGAEMTGENWADAGARCLGMLLDGRAQPTGIRRRGSDATLLLIFNAHHEAVPFTLPEAPGGSRWVGLIDTNDPGRTEPPSFACGSACEIAARSLRLLVLTDADAKAQPRRLRDGVAAILSVAEAPVEEDRP